MSDPDRTKKLEAMFAEANEVLRSFAAVCNRKGENTNWEALTVRVHGVLRHQHEFMHPEYYVSPRAG